MPYNLQSPYSCLRLRRCVLDLSGDILVNRRDPIASFARIKAGDANAIQRRSYILSGKALLLAVGQ